MATSILKVRYTLLVFVIFSLFIPYSAQSDTYIIHMNLSAMPKIFPHHHSWYAATVSSISETITATSKLMYSYTSCVHGFSATLTNSELDSLKKSHGYLSFTRDHPLRPHTTHTPQFLGLSHSASVSSWPASKEGEDVIIGVVDTGIWPESESFNDEGMSEIPSRWRGECVSGVKFNPSSCNKKLIGAQFFNKGLLASNPRSTIDIYSPRDINGHGTHTSSTAAGNYVKGASYFGYANGTARGMATRARIAMYKAIWEGGIYASDVLAAMDQAIQDGVDILSLSLGSSDENVLYHDIIAIAGFAAMQKGILVAASAGNDGPIHWTVFNGAPWIVTVAAGTVDRKFEGVLTLENGKRITFTSLYPGNSSLAPAPLVFLNECDNVQDLQKFRNSIVVCNDHESISTQMSNAESAGVTGAVFVTKDTSLSPFDFTVSFPAAFVGLQEGEIVINYIQNNNHPRGNLQFHRTVLGAKPAPKVDYYSSRGPYLSCQNVLKPDLLAPGSLVLASWSPISSVANDRSRHLFSNFNLASGTSMSTPHLAGAAALIRSAHPDWSPAAIRSALMTTANSLDNTLSPIKDVASNNSPASPLEMGAGHINPIKALEPGLIYDATSEDYTKLLCAMKYTAKQIQIITKSIPNCANKSLDLNYPSFIAFFGTDESKSGRREFQRTLTNVGEGVSSYSAKVTGMERIKVGVAPQKLVFHKKNEKLRFRLTLQGRIEDEEVVHGSLIWVHDGGKYEVRSPIVVTSLVPEFPLKA